MAESQWLAFVKADNFDKKKTDQFYVNNKVNNSCVGMIKWYGAFRKYVFYPTPNFIFDSACLKDIASYLSALMLERKVKSQESKG
jgi:hypothetical protein